MEGVFRVGYDFVIIVGKFVVLSFPPRNGVQNGGLCTFINFPREEKKREAGEGMSVYSCYNVSNNRN